MSKRPIELKRRRKVAKAFRQKLPAYFDVQQWLVDHKYAPSLRQAKELILADRLKYDGSTIGVSVVPYRTPDGNVKTERVAERNLEVFFRSGLSVEVAA